MEIVDNGLLLSSISVLSAILGSIATVFLQKGYGWLQRPNLSIEFEQKEPFCRIASIRGSGISSYWIRIRVRNKRKRVGKCCVGKLMEIRKIKDENEEVVTSFDPSALSWVAFKDIEKLAINGRKQYNGWLKKIGVLDINRGEYEYLDIVTLKKLWIA